MDCPRCTSDMERITEERWHCPACGLVEWIPVIPVVTVDPPELAKEKRDECTKVAGLMPELAQQHPEHNDVWQKLYQMFSDMAEEYDNLAGGA